MKDLAEKMEEAAKKNADKDPSGAASMSKAGKKTQEASGEMNKAGKQMDQKDNKSAQENQDNAKKALEEARKELDKLTQRELTEEQKRKLEQLKERQRELEEKLKKMTEATAKIPEKKSADSMSKAGDSMSQTQQSQQKQDTQQAQKDSEQTEEHLEKAMEDLKEAERQYAQQLQEEQLQQIENTIQDLVTKQEAINNETTRLDGVKKKDGDLGRKEQLDVRKIAAQQDELKKTAEEMRKKIEDEGSQVYTWVLETCRDDMGNIAEELRKQEVGEYTQEVEGDVLGRLKELVSALQKERGRRKKQQQQGGGGGGKGPLIPDIAELKLLRTMQVQLKQKTERFGKDSTGQAVKELDPIQKAILARLRAEQGHIAQLTRNFTDKMKEKMQGGGK
jgi:hypothetical protein